MVMADDSVGRRMPFTFLGELQRKFTTRYSTDVIFDAPAYGLGEFSDEIAKLMNYYTNTPQADALSAAQADLAQVKDIMVHNVEQILSRGERIELLVDKTNDFAAQAHMFRRGARNVRRQQFWRNQKIMFLSVVIALFFFYLILADFCGAKLQCGS